MLKRRTRKWKNRSQGQKRRWMAVSEKTKTRLMTALSGKSLEKSTFDERSGRIKAGKARMPSLRMGRAAKKAARTRVSKLTERERTEIGKRLGIERMAKLSKAERTKLASDAAKAFWQGLSIEEIRRIQRKRGKKSGKKRREKRLGKLGYVDALPELNLLGKREIEALFRRNAGILDSFVSKYEGNRDFDEIRQEIYFGFVVAVSKWDRKMPLRKLTQDAIQLQLIKYFSTRKGYMARRRGIEAAGVI